MESTSDALFRDRERTMFIETLSSGQTVTLFAIPVEKGTYRAFGTTPSPSATPMPILSRLWT